MSLAKQAVATTSGGSVANPGLVKRVTGKARGFFTRARRETKAMTNTTKNPVNMANIVAGRTLAKMKKKPAHKMLHGLQHAAGDVEGAIHHAKGLKLLGQAVGEAGKLVMASEKPEPLAKRATR